MNFQPCIKKLPAKKSLSLICTLPTKLEHIMKAHLQILAPGDNSISITAGHLISSTTKYKTLTLHSVKLLLYALAKLSSAFEATGGTTFAQWSILTPTHL